MPEIVGDESVGVKYAINGLLSVTYDGLPLLGETPEVKGLWSAAAIWIKEGPGAGKTVAELMVHGESEIDVFESNIARAYPSQKTRTHVFARAAEGFNKMYGIVHPSEQWESDRGVRVPPFYERERGRGAVFYEAAGWERPVWYEENAGLLDEYGDRVDAPRVGVGCALVVADHQCRAPGDARSGGDRRSDRLCDLRRDRPGRARRRPTRGDAPDGCAGRSCRLHAAADAEWNLQAGPDDHATGRRRLPRRHRRRLRHVRSQVVQGPPARRTVRRRFTIRRARWATLGLWGPRARDILSSIARGDVSHEGFPFARCKSLEVGPVEVLASRISYVGDLGWELYVPIEQGARLWDLLFEAGEPHGMIAAGSGVYGTTGRLEKGYRAYGAELDGEYNVVEAGMAWGSRSRIRTSSARGAHRAPRRGAGRRDVHADRRRSHLDLGGQALHAGPGADPHARRRRRSPTARAGAPM